jgi:hypothetical protein
MVNKIISSRKLTVRSARARRVNKKRESLVNNTEQYGVARFNAKAYPLPDNFRTTLVYYDQIDYTAVVTPQLYIFRGNGPFDPDQTGTGSQPVGWDNLTTFYSVAGPVASRIRIKAFNQTTAALQIGVLAATTTTMVTSYEQMRYVGATARFMDLDGTTRGGRSFGSMASTGVSTKVIGRPWNSAFLTQVTTNPSQQWYWIIAIQTADQATAISMNLQITVEYDIVFSDPKFVALS